MPLSVFVYCTVLLYVCICLNPIVSVFIIMLHMFLVLENGDRVHNMSKPMGIPGLTHTCTRQGFNLCTHTSLPVILSLRSSKIVLSEI